MIILDVIYSMVSFIAKSFWETSISSQGIWDVSAQILNIFGVKLWDPFTPMVLIHMANCFL